LPLDKIPKVWYNKVLEGGKDWQSKRHMKIIVLLEVGNTDSDTIIEIAKSKGCNPRYINTSSYDEETEYNVIVDAVDDFSSSIFGEILFIKFSGRESIARCIGDEFSEMVIVLSCNKFSEYYTECPVCTFLELLNSLEKERYQNKYIRDERPIYV